jgi:hypothetical protein
VAEAVKAKGVWEGMEMMFMGSGDIVGGRFPVDGLEKAPFPGLVLV